VNGYLVLDPEFTARGLVHFSADQLDLADTRWPKTST